MDPKNPSIRWVEALFDVSEPYLYVLVLPPLVLFALGYRRSALVTFVGAGVAFAVLGAT